MLTTTVVYAGACDAPPYRQFDFWVGDWQVHKPDGKLAGFNRVTKEYGGCVIHEHYTTNHGYNGESLNIYDASRQLWHQTWVDNAGTLLVLEGRFINGKMKLEGHTVEGNGKTARHRITWTPNPDGSVRQFWEATDANGKWGTVFDGLYTRRQGQKNTE